jgi:hypothetical protein
MRPGALPFPASGIVPSTSTVFPVSKASFEFCDSETSVSISFDPEIFSWVLSFTTTIVPVIAALASFIVKPFFVMASCSCLSVVVLAGFIFTDASPFARLTSTESTPDTDFNDTRTAWAQTSQSIPKIVMSIDWISAAAEAMNSHNTESSTTDLFISSPNVNAGIADS